MFFEASMIEPKFNINPKGYNINFQFLISEKTIDVLSKSNEVVYKYSDFELKIIYTDKYINIVINSFENINELKFKIYSESSLLLIHSDVIKFSSLSNESLLIINYSNLYQNNEFIDVIEIEFEKDIDGYIGIIRNILKDSKIEIGISIDSFIMGSVPGIMSVSSSDRSIYQPSEGDTSFSIYLFQGFYSNPETGEQIIDYPLDSWNGIQVAGAIPLSSALVGNDLNLEESFNKGLSLDSITIYIEFVANHQIGIEGFAPSLYYDIISPIDTALHFYNQQAIFIGNINGVSVYRGQYTIHKQSIPTYVDGIHKIIFRMQKSLFNELEFDVQVQNIYTIVGVSSIGDSSISP